MEFTFSAIDPAGARISDVVQAEDEERAIRAVQGRGLMLLDIASRGTSAVAEPAISLKQRFSRRIPADQMVLLSRELAIMIETGVPIVDAMTTLSEHSADTRIRDSLHAVTNDVSSGKTFSEALEAHPALFTPLYISMVRTAEYGGNLATTLRRAADYQENSLQMRRRMTGALAYPGVLIFVVGSVVLFLLLYVIPKFAALFTSMKMEVPMQTRILLGASLFLRTNWWLIPLTVVAAVAFVRTAGQRPAIQMAVTRLFLKVPVFGDILAKIAVARLLYTLGSLLESGVSILIALELSADNVQNPHFAQAIRQAQGNVEVGESLSASLIATNCFPPAMCRMAAVGEQSGQISNVLLRLARFYDQEVDARLKTLSTVIEPLLIVIIGIVVGFIAISIIGPIYSLMDGVK